MGGSDSTQTSQQQQQVQLPPWVNQAAQQNYGYAQNIANQPLQQYQGQLVAGVSPQQQQSWNTAAQAGSAGQPQFNASQAGYLGVLGSQPQQVQAGQLSNTDLQPYLNPYTQNVINATLPIMQQQLGLNQIGNQSQAAGAGAYGGSRQAIQQGVTQAQGAQNMAQMAAQLNQANFGQAQNAAEQDIQGRMQAALANQNVGQNQTALNLQAASGLGGLGQQALSSQAQTFAEQQAAGQAQQQQQQNQINAQLAKYNQAWSYPYQQLGVLQSALGMTPYGQASTGLQTTQTQTAADPLGALFSGLGAIGSLGGSGGLGGLFKFASRGMTKVPGVGTHDHVPMMLAPGEAVLNRGAAGKLGRGKIAKLNASYANPLQPPIPVNPPGITGPNSMRLPVPAMGGGPQGSPMAGALAGLTPGVGALGAPGPQTVPRIRQRRGPAPIRGALLG
jgi:hypothetical protein